MQQATFQWRATSGTSFNCIVFGVSREGWGNLDKPQLAGLRWPGSTRVVVLGQVVGDHVLAIRICVRIRQSSLRFSLAFVGVEAFCGSILERR